MKTWAHKETIRSWETNWIAETRGRVSFRHTPRPSRRVLPARRTQKETQRTSHATADREDRAQGFPLQPKGTGHHEQQMPLRSRPTNGGTYSPALPPTDRTLTEPITPTRDDLGSHWSSPLLTSTQSPRAEPATPSTWPKTNTDSVLEELEASSTANCTAKPLNAEARLKHALGQVLRRKRESLD